MKNQRQNRRMIDASPGIISTYYSAGLTQSQEQKTTAEKKHPDYLFTTFLLAFPVVIILIALITASRSQTTMENYNGTAPASVVVVPANTSQPLSRPQPAARQNGKVSKMVPQP